MRVNYIVAFFLLGLSCLLSDFIAAEFISFLGFLLVFIWGFLKVSFGFFEDLLISRDKRITTIASWLLKNIDTTECFLAVRHYLIVLISN